MHVKRAHSVPREVENKAHSICVCTFIRQEDFVSVVQELIRMDLTKVAAYGGEGWRPRTTSLRQELGTIWGDWGVDSEYAPLSAVLLHLPTEEIEDLVNPDDVQMLAPVEASLLRKQHDTLAEAYRSAEVQVHYVLPSVVPPPNTMFVRDVFFMTPEGAILARPASTVRAGERDLLRADWPN